MASGDTLVVFTMANNEPPATNPAVPDLRNGHLVADFTTGGSDEEAVFSGVMPENYAGTTGVTVTLVWMASTAILGDVVWQAAFERHADDAFSLDTDVSWAFNTSGAVTAPSALGETSYDDITFTDGADMDSLVAGESFRLKIRRDQDDTSGTDDMTGDAELLRVHITET
jgi:hypothetical protein